MAKKHDLSDKNFRLTRAAEVAVRKICTSPTGSALSARKLAWLPESFGPTFFFFFPFFMDR
jgi:hypothetical protein